MAIPPYQAKLSEMLRDERIFILPMKKILEPDIIFSIYTVSHIMKAEAEVVKAAELLTGNRCGMGASEKLNMYALLGSFKGVENMGVLADVLFINSSHVIKTLLLIKDTLIEKICDEADLKLAAAALIEAGKEIKNFEKTLTKR